MFQPMEPKIMTAKSPECQRKHRSLHAPALSQHVLGGATLYPAAAGPRWAAGRARASAPASREVRDACV
jgi:hypothetical protein